MASNNTKIPQFKLEYNRDELVSLPVTVLVGQYPNGSAFNWKFQVLNDSAEVLLNVTGSATIADLKFTIPLSKANTLATPEGVWPASIVDTTNSRRIAEGIVSVGPAQV